MKKSILFFFILLPLIGFSQSNEIQVGALFGTTPYLIEWGHKTIGYDVQYARSLNSNFTISLAFGQMINHDSFDETFTNFEGKRFIYGLDETEKSLYVDFDLEYAILKSNRYTLQLGIGASWFKDEFEYIKDITFKDENAVINSATNELTSRMFNIVIENKFDINNHLFLNFKTIVRRQFYNDHVLQYTSRNLDIGGTTQGALVFIGNYNMILSLGYKF